MAEYHSQEDVPTVDVDVVRELKLQKEEKSTLAEEQQQHHSCSSSSDDEGEAGEKKRKKGLKEKIKEKISHQDEERNGRQDESVPTEKCNGMAKEESTNPEEKGLLEKLIGKLPGQHKKGEEADQATPTECAPDKNSPEKKGILERIKEKLPGTHKKEEKDKEKQHGSSLEDLS